MIDGQWRPCTVAEWLSLRDMQIEWVDGVTQHMIHGSVLAERLRSMRFDQAQDATRYSLWASMWRYPIVTPPTFRVGPIV